MYEKKSENTKQSLISIQSTGEVETNVVALVVKNSDYFKRLSGRFLGGTLVPATYGQGPLGYEGKETKNNAVFGGSNKADKNRHIFVFFGKTGVNQLESALNDDQYADIWPNTHFQRIEAELAIPFTKEMEANLFTESLIEGTNEVKIEGALKELAINLTEQKKYRPKAYFSAQRKVLVLGSSSSIQLIIGVEPYSSKGSKHKVVLKASFNNATAKNMHAAVLGSQSRRLDSVTAMMSVKMLSLVEVNPIMNAINEVCSGYRDASLLLTKRERDKIQLNSKVTYFRGALSSMLKHLEELPTNEAEQYAIVLEPFIKELIGLAETCDPAQKALDVFVFHLKPVITAEGRADKP